MAGEYPKWRSATQFEFQALLVTVTPLSVRAKASFYGSANDPYTADDSMVLASFSPSISVCRQRVARVERQRDPVTCVLANQVKLLLPRLLAPYVNIGDEIAFSDSPTDSAGPEIYLTKKSFSRGGPCAYLAPIEYVSLPKEDKRKRYFVSAEVRQGKLGVNTILLPSGILREYFYRLPQINRPSGQRTLYDILPVRGDISASELRVAFKLRDLELQAAGARQSERVVLERAFNILAHPESRACYDALLGDAETPAIFPYGGFGSLLVAGESSRDGKTFFARRILAFSPELRRRTFHVPLRKCEFYDDRALCRDASRNLEFWLDSALLHTTWDRTWNQWKHSLRAKIEVQGTFVQSGKYRKRRGEWGLVTCETALPSRLQVKLPADFQQQVEMARETHHRFGQYSRALDQIRLCLEHRAIEKVELQRMCSQMGIPGDFDIAQINWRPDYDPFFYRQLFRRARCVYLFRDEYIFDVEKAVVVETPQLGHATYIFAKPRSLDCFLVLYTKISKEDIRRNRDNVGERLGYLDRVIHRTDPRAWLKEMRGRLGERADFALAVAD